MLPPGHIAAGFLTAEVLLKFAKPDLPQTELNQLLVWGMLFGFAPDLDTFVSFAREHRWFQKDQANNHRKFISHAPFLWLLAGLLVYLASGSTYWKLVGLLLWLASWSHFLLDSIDYGIMWLWPFSRKVYAIRNREIARDIPRNTFFSYWWYFLRSYTGLATFYAELIIIFASIIVYFRF